ncbi:MAG: hypothetical protein KA734_07535 [Fluviicola sp.]|nr:hypothetical protein [Fluviicola sp.]
MFILMGCSEDKKVTPTHNKNSTNAIEETKPTNFPIEVIINNCEKRKSNYNLDYGFNDKTKLIQSEFFKKYLAKYAIKNINDFKMVYDKYSRYYFFDFVEFDEFVSFTIIHNDEVGYDNYYHYTYDKENDKIIDVVMIASVGGDGGHGQDELLFYSNALKDLLVKTKSEYDEDLFDKGHKNCYSRLSDIYEIKYRFRQDNTEIIEGKTETFTDTICK